MVSEEKLVDKLSRFFHCFPFEFQAEYRITLEHPIEIDDYLNNGEQRHRRVDIVLITPNNTTLLEIKPQLLNETMIKEVVLERRYLQRFEAEHPATAPKLMFIAPQISKEARDLILFSNALLQSKKYSAVTLKQFASDILSRFNAWCESNRDIVSDNKQAVISRTIAKDCALLFLFG